MIKAEFVARWGVTLIPPESLAAFQDMILSDKRIHEDDQLVLLSSLVQQAIDSGAYMIHYGV